MSVCQWVHGCSVSNPTPFECDIFVERRRTFKFILHGFTLEFKFKFNGVAFQFKFEFNGSSFEFELKFEFEFEHRSRIEFI